MLLFGVYLDLLPITGLKSFNFSELTFFGKIADLARHLVLPVFISAIGGLAGMSRFMKSSLLEVLRQDYITTAYAKGLPERMILRKHALRNALLSVITLARYVCARPDRGERDLRDYLRYSRHGTALLHERHVP